MERINKLIKIINVTNDLRLIEKITKCLSAVELLHVYIKLKPGRNSKFVQGRLLNLSQDSWNVLSRTKNLKENILEEFKEKLNWTIVSKFVHVTLNILITFQNLLCFEELAKRVIIPEFLLKRNYNNINFKRLMKYQQLSEDFLMFLINTPSEVECSRLTDMDIDSYLKIVYWPEIIKYQNINFNFINLMYTVRVSHQSRRLRKIYKKMTRHYQGSNATTD